jgi:hypothetical protein
VLCSIIIFAVTHAQDRLRVESPTYIYQISFTKTGSESWGYGGIDVVGSNSIIFPFSNPALIPANHFSAAIEFTRRIKTSGPLILKWDDPYIIPSYAVLQFPVKGLKLATGYANYYDLQVYLEPFPISTIQQPGGTGEFFDVEINLRNQTLFAAVQHTVHPKFSIGITLGANYFDRYERISSFEAKADGWGWQSVLGIAYSPTEYLTFGASFRYLNEIDYTFDVSTEQLVVSDPDTGTGGSNDTLNANLQSEFSSATKFPWEFKIGLNYRFQSRVQIFTMINFQGWSSINSSYNDQQQFHLGMQVRAFSATRYSLGFFTQMEGDESKLLIAKYLNQKYISLGLAQKLFSKFQFNISLLDSRLFSNPDVAKDFGEETDEFHQTNILLGLKCNFL